MKLIVGLGNPGTDYANTRHNVGFMCVSNLAKLYRIEFDKKQGHARTGMGNIAGYKTVLARPQTYMNSSGASVASLVNKLSINISDVIVIHDDLDLPIGKIRLRLGGRSGGHKGIESIIDHLGSREFYRVKVGIGREIIEQVPPQDKEAAVISYVLSNFTGEEKAAINETITQVSQAISCLLTEGLEAAMNKYN
jgi:PTH1 family peptidyl-tRNA hydrolase